jgi:Rieske Fe-S protein
MDPATRTLRDGSRLNKILLIRLPLESLAADHPARRSAGVLAFSAICTHQGCVVSGYLPAEHNLMCPCHFSKFDVLDSGHVAGGPAPRPLPTLGLALAGKELVLTSGFSETPGVKRSS